MNIRTIKRRMVRASLPRGVTGARKKAAVFRTAWTGQQSASRSSSYRGRVFGGIVEKFRVKSGSALARLFNVFSK